LNRRKNSSALRKGIFNDRQTGLIYGLHPNKKAIPPKIITMKGSISNNNFKVVRNLPIPLRMGECVESPIPFMTDL
jgi:hypothetical protein